MKLKRVIEKAYELASRHAGKIVVGSFLLTLSAISLDAILNTKTGSFIEPQTGRKYQYALVDRRNSRHLYVWPETSHALFASKIRDFDADGIIDHVGSFTYPRMPFEFNRLKARPDYREGAQNLYNLASADSEK